MVHAGGAGGARAEETELSARFARDPPRHLAPGLPSPDLSRSAMVYCAWTGHSRCADREIAIAL